MVKVEDLGQGLYQKVDEDGLDRRVAAGVRGLADAKRNDVDSRL